MLSNIKLQMTPSQVREYHVAQDTALETLERLGIQMTNRTVSMDAAVPGITTPSVVTPLQFLQHYLPTPIRTVTSPRKIDELVGRNIVADWCDEEVVTTVIESKGSARPYGDYTSIPLASFNVNFEKRTIVRFEEGIEVTKLDQERANKIRINIASEKREAASTSLAIELNRIGFYGYNDGKNRTYGFLNEPSLPAYTTVATGAASNTKWSTKTYLEICADIRTAVAALRVRSGDLFDPYTDSFTMAISLSAVEYLSVVSNYGNSVRDWIKETYPSCKIVSCVELDKANGGSNVFYLYAEKIDGKPVWANNVVTVYRMLGNEQKIKGYQEGYSNATSGIMLNYPVGIVRYTGI